MQKQAIEMRSDTLLAESPRIIEEKDVRLESIEKRMIIFFWLIQNELKHLRETTNAVLSNNLSTNLLDNQYNATQFVKYEQVINELKYENTHLKNEVLNLKKTLELQEQTEKEYDEQIHALQLRVKELEDWNEDYQGL